MTRNMQFQYGAIFLMEVIGQAIIVCLQIICYTTFGKKKWQKRISLGRLPPQVIVFKGSQSLTTVKVTKGPCSSLPWSPLHS